MRELEYPFDPGYIMKKRRSIKKELLKTDKPFIEKQIATLLTHNAILVSEAKEAVLFGYKKVAFLMTEMGLIELVES